MYSWVQKSRDTAFLTQIVTCSVPCGSQVPTQVVRLAHTRVNSLSHLAGLFKGKNVITN